MLNQVALGTGGAQRPCCNMMKQPETPFALRIGGMPLLPGFPILSTKAFSDHVTEQYLGNPSFKVTGKMPGEKKKPIALKTQEDLDKVLSAGGEINLIMIHFPLVGLIPTEEA